MFSDYNNIDDENRDVKVATLNNKTGELEWQLPTQRQVYDNSVINQGMYSIELEDGSMMKVSEKHRVYSAVENEGGNNQRAYPNNLSTNSLDVNTLINDCSLRCGSLDQIGRFLDSANAMYGASSSSDIDFRAFLKNLLYSATSMNSIEDSTSFCLISNSCAERLDLNRHSSLCSSNSDLMNFGAINSSLRKENKYELIEDGFMSEKNMFASNISDIVYLSNSALSSGDNSANNFLNLPFLAFAPSSTLHLSNSCSSSEFSLTDNSLNLLSLSARTPLTNPDQLTQSNLAILFLNSSSNVNVKLAIYLVSPFFDFSDSSSSVTLDSIALRAASTTFTSGNTFLNSSNSLSGMNKVIFDMLVDEGVYFNTSNYLEVYKPYENEFSDACNFRLFRL